MTTRKLIAVCIIAAAASLSLYAAEEPKKSGGATDERVAKIDDYVRGVEAKRSSLTRKEAMLDPQSLANATDEKWSKVHVYSDGDKLARVKVYPTEGSRKTEEFYYDNDKLAFVFIEPDGVGKENHDADAKGTKYYFASGRIFAMSTNGKVTPPDDQARAMGEKLQRESKAFRAAAK